MPEFSSLTSHKAMDNQQGEDHSYRKRGREQKDPLSDLPGVHQKKLKPSHFWGTECFLARCFQFLSDYRDLIRLSRASKICYQVVQLHPIYQWIEILEKKKPLPERLYAENYSLSEEGIYSLTLIGLLYRERVSKSQEPVDLMPLLRCSQWDFFIFNSTPSLAYLGYYSNWLNKRSNLEALETADTGSNLKKMLIGLKGLERLIKKTPKEWTKGQILGVDWQWVVSLVHGFHYNDFEDKWFYPLIEKLRESLSNLPHHYDSQSLATAILVLTGNPEKMPFEEDQLALMDKGNLSPLGASQAKLLKGIFDNYQENEGFIRCICKLTNFNKILYFAPLEMQKKWLVSYFSHFPTLLSHLHPKVALDVEINLDLLREYPNLWLYLDEDLYENSQFMRAACRIQPAIIKKWASHLTSFEDQEELDQVDGFIGEVVIWNPIVINYLSDQEKQVLWNRIQETYSEHFSSGYIFEKWDDFDFYYLCLKEALNNREANTNYPVYEENMMALAAFYWMAYLQKKELTNIQFLGLMSSMLWTFHNDVSLTRQNLSAWCDALKKSHFIDPSHLLAVDQRMQIAFHYLSNQSAF